MKKLIAGIEILITIIITSFAAYAVESSDLRFTSDESGKYIYCNNHEFIRRIDLADTSNENAKFIMNNENLTADNYALFASHINHTELRNSSGTQIIEPGFDIELDVLFRAREDTVINLTALGFEVPAHKQYWYQGTSYTYEEEWGCFNAWASYMQLPIHQIHSGTLYTPNSIEPVKINIKKGEKLWLSDYIPNYREVPFYRPVNLLADFTIISGICDVNIAALKSTGRVGDRSTFVENAAYGSYERDRQYKGIADSLNKADAELSYTIDDYTWSDTQLPVKVFNRTHPDGFETHKWYTHLNPMADEWSYAICTQSDMLSFKYYDPSKLHLYGAAISEEERDGYWYFDTEHHDAFTYPGKSFGLQSKYIPNGIMNDKLPREYACNLGNYGVILNYKIDITNNGSMIRYFNYRLNTGSNNVVILRDVNGRLINPYAVCKGANASRVLDNMACVELPAQQTTSFIVQVILTTNYAGGMENSMTITDTPQMVEVYNSNRQEIIKDYNYTGREFYKWDNNKLYFSNDTQQWSLKEISPEVLDIFKGNWNEYEIKYTGGGYMIKSALYDGTPYYGVREFFKTVYFLDERLNLIYSEDFRNYPTEMTAANGLYYVKAGTPYYSSDMREWTMGDSKMPCWNYGCFSAKVKNGEIYLSTDGKEFTQVDYRGFKPSYIDSLGNIYYYADGDTLYLSGDGIYWEQIKADENISSLYKTDEEIVINRRKHFKLPEIYKNIAVKADGKYIGLEKAPIMTEHCLMLPLRAICEWAGAEVVWQNGAVSVTYGDNMINVITGSDTALINSKDIHMEEAADVYSGTMMVSAEFMANALGYEFKYEGGIAVLTR